MKTCRACPEPPMPGYDWCARHTEPYIAPKREALASNQYLLLLGEYKQSHAVTAVDALALARFVEWLDAGCAGETPAPRFVTMVTEDGEVTVETCPRCAYPAPPVETTAQPTAQPGRCKSMHTVQCQAEVGHDGDHLHNLVGWRDDPSPLKAGG